MRKRTKLLLAFVVVLTVFFIYLFTVTKMEEPEHIRLSDQNLPVLQLSDSLSVCGDSWMKLNEYGLWELFVQGDPYTMGFKNGQLSKNLVQYQEEAFVAQLDKLVPSRFYLQFLRVFLGWFNRDLLNYIPKEYQLEVAGISKSASDEFNFIAPPFQRIMSYHGAHDMGHALQSMCLVGCTSFGLTNDYSADSSVLIGRNFDFYAGDQFSENKIIAFMKPDDGYPFMSVTWGGMIGVVSGMNLEGLTITLNAEPTGIPTSSKTPVSILARKILQYASTIDEAYAIAQQYETFVSESFLIGSGKENQFALIEKTPDKIALLHPKENYLAVTNHFLDSSMLLNGADSLSHFVNASHYRLNRVEELIDSTGKFSVQQVADLLRDRKGTKGANIGLGNEKAINQLIAHHGIIFKPEEKKVWISAAPFQLGAFVAYDLNEIFADPQAYRSKNLYLSDDVIAADAMLQNEEYTNFLKYKAELLKIQKGIKEERDFPKEELDAFIPLNEAFYYPYQVVGNYYFEKGEFALAKIHFEKALQLEIPQESEYEELSKLSKESNELMLKEK
ncbi:C45 family autoproteolytic acyltransferase/hydolase [Labilibaculum euxinus]